MNHKSLETSIILARATVRHRELHLKQSKASDDYPNLCKCFINFFFGILLMLYLSSSYWALCSIIYRYVYYYLLSLPVANVRFTYVLHHRSYYYFLLWRELQSNLNHEIQCHSYIILYSRYYIVGEHYLS